MSKEKIDIGQLIDEETERRLKIMKEPDYEWPKKAGKGDAIAIVTSILACIILILLCVTEVIV